jgi:hypothetical protein
MARDKDKGTYQVGFGKPPKKTRFSKGQSGNLKGRPKGAKSLGTILKDAGRQLIQVTEKGRTRQITKLQAIVIQLINEAAKGNLKAIREYFHWVRAFAEFEETGTLPPPIANERDSKVMKSILKRLERQKESVVSLPDPESGEKESL